MTVEDEKFNNLLCASQRPKKAGGIVAVSVQKPWESQWCKSLSEGRRKSMSQLNQSGRESEFSLFLSFRTNHHITDCMIPTHTGEGNLFYLEIQV